MTATTDVLARVGDLTRRNRSDGAEGEIAGCDLSFEFAGRRWEYRRAYDRYVLLERVGGLELETGPDSQCVTWEPDAIRTHPAVFPAAPADAKLRAAGLTVRVTPRCHVAERPADADARTLWEARDGLRRLAAPRPAGRDEDRTGYHKGDTSL